MEVAFRDKLLTCSECGNQFVYTVGQQRMAYEEEGEVVEPRFCPVCEVKLERGGQRPERSEPYTEPENRPMNGSQFRRDSGPYSAPEERQTASQNRGEGEQPSPYGRDDEEESSENQADSSDNSTEYRSGAEHQLAGHHGEVHYGHVKWFNDRKGFGFITLDEGIDLFVHYSGIVGEGYKTLKEGQRVRITVEDTDKGPQASEVTVMEEEVEQEGDADTL